MRTIISVDSEGGGVTGNTPNADASPRAADFIALASGRRVQRLLEEGGQGDRKREKRRRRRRGRRTEDGALESNSLFPEAVAKPEDG